MPDYFFRDDIEADKQRAADAAANGVAPTLTAPAPSPAAAPAAPQAPKSPDFGALAKAATAAPQPAKPDYFADFKSALAEQDPFRAKAQQAVSDTLANPTAAFDASASAQTDKLGREIGAEQERRRQAAVLQFGGNQTGQVGKTLDAFQNEALMKQAELGRDLSAGRAQAAEAARGNAINQSLGLLQEGRTGAGQAASLGLQQEGQRDQAALARKAQGLDEAKFQAADANAKKGLDLEANAQALQKLGLSLEDARYYAGIASQEKVAFAGLNLDEKKFLAADANAKKGLDLEASAQALQATGMAKEDARYYAGLAQAKMLADKGFSLEEASQALQKQGMNQEDARYYAGLALQEKEGAAGRATQEKIAFAQIGSQEKMQASQQAHEAAQNDLSRSLEKMLSNDRITAQFQLADLDHVFQEKIQKNGFVQEKDIEAMRADLQKTLQDKGIAADQAKQIADQKFSEMMANKDQAFQASQADLQRKWASGERIDTQTWEQSMKASDQQHDETLAKLSSTLRLDEAKNAQAFQTSFQAMQNNFTELMDQKGFEHNIALQTATQQFQKEMEQAGFSHEDAMQASAQAADLLNNRENRASQEMMATASLAQQDSQFMQELQQRYQFNSTDITLRQQELNGQLQLMGLQGEQLKQTLADSRVDNALKMVSLGMEIGDGSAGAMAPFVAMFGQAVSSALKDQGISMSADDIGKALAPQTGGAPTGQAAITGLSSALNKTGNAPEQNQEVTDYVTSIRTKYLNAAPGQKVSGLRDTVGGANMDAAVTRLRSAGVSQDTLNKLMNRDRVGDGLINGSKYEYKGTPEFINYTLYSKLLDSGLSPADAQKSLVSLLGSDKAYAALALDPTVASSSKVAPMDFSGLVGLNFSGMA